MSSFGDETDLGRFDAIVYDLDGTLVRLTVDWAQVTADVLDVYETAGIDASDRDLWQLSEEADEYGIEREVEAVIADHERTGARTSRELQLTAELRSFSGPTGVCSLNCEDACRIALETHDLDEHVDAIVGRDTVETRKPDPLPLQRAIEAIGAEQSSTLFVGDSRSDETTADRAGVSFRYAPGAP